MLNNKILIVTHIDLWLDGSGVEILWRLAFPDADVIRVNYGWEDELENRQKLADYGMILFGDISFRPSFAKILNGLGKSLTLFDHHESALNKFKEEGIDYDWIHFDTSKCGTLLVYESLKQCYPSFDADGKYKELAVLIDDYDRWVHNDSRSIDLQFLWSGLGKDNFVEKFLYSPSLMYTPEELDIINDSRNKLQLSYDRAIESMAPFHYKDSEGNQFNYCSDVPHFGSLVAMMIQKRYPELDYIVLESGYGSLSFRSTKYPVNQIAESLGGGGHCLASGCKKVDGMDVVNSVINRKVTMYDFMDKFKVTT